MDQRKRFWIAAVCLAVAGNAFAGEKSENKDELFGPATPETRQTQDVWMAAELASPLVPLLAAEGAVRVGTRQDRSAWLAAQRANVDAEQALRNLKPGVAAVVRNSAEKAASETMFDASRKYFDYEEKKSRIYRRGLIGGILVGGYAMSDIVARGVILSKNQDPGTFPLGRLTVSGASGAFSRIGSVFSGKGEVSGSATAGSSSATDYERTYEAGAGK